MDIYLDKNLKEINAVLAISEALRKCGENDTLHLGGGQLVLDNTYAHATNCYLPRYTDRTKYYAVTVKDKKNLVIDGDGAELLLKGDVSCFELCGCENVTLKNFKIDIYNPFYWQGVITESCDEYFDVKFDEEISPCIYDKDKKVFRIQRDGQQDYLEAATMLVNEFDPKMKRTTLTSPDYFICADKPDPFYDFMSVVVNTTELGDNKYRFSFADKNKTVKHTVGSYFVATNHERRNNNIHAYRCKNLTLENIDMYASASFGVISLLTENFTVRNVNSVLKPNTDRMLAVVADMFHCVNNSGKVIIDGCTLNNQKDDPINVHSLLCEIERVLDDGFSAIVSFPYRAKRAHNLFTEGEKLHTLTSDTFEEGNRELTVKTSEFLGQYRLRMTFHEKLDKSMEGLILESTDAMPEISITNCSLGNNRGRGILITSSRRTVVENNRIYCQGEGISISGASRFYMEGGAVTDVTVRNNVFDDCSYRSHSAVIIVPDSVAKSRTSPYHSNITITDNIFKLRKDIAIKASLVDGLIVKNNTFTDVISSKSKRCIAELTNCVNSQCEDLDVVIG